MSSVSCNGFAISAEFTPSYNDPFKLSMTINTNHLQSGDGGIFSDHIGSDRVDIVWLEDEIEVSQVESKIKFHILNSGVSVSDGIRITRNLSKSLNYDLEINFDGRKCNILLDGDVVGNPIDCSSGFKVPGSPKLCYTDDVGRWLGAITNLKFEGSEGKVSGISITNEGKFYYKHVNLFSLEMCISLFL